MHPAARWRAVALAVMAVAVLPAAAHAQACTKPQQLGVAMMVDDSGSMEQSDPNELRREGVGLAIDQLSDGSVAAAGSFDSSSREFFGPREVNGYAHAGCWRRRAR